MKKITAIFLTLCISFLLIVPTAALGYPTEEEISFLQTIGIPEEFFELVDNKKIHDMYEKAKDGTLRYGGKQTISMTSDTDVATYGIIPESDMSFTSFMFLNFESDQITYKSLELYVEYEWDYMHPTVKREDAITVNWDSSLFVLKPNSFSSSWGSKTLGDFFSYSHSSAPAILDQGGLGYYVGFQPALGSGAKYAGVAVMYLEPRSKIYYDEKANVTSINMQYTHNKTPLVGSIDFITESGAISITLPPMTDSVAMNRLVRYRE